MNHDHFVGVSLVFAPCCWASPLDSESEGWWHCFALSRRSDEFGSSDKSIHRGEARGRNWAETGVVFACEQPQSGSQTERGIHLQEIRLIKNSQD